MKPFTKTTVVTYTPKWVRKTFSVYSEDFKRIRATMGYKCQECFKCYHCFELGESIALACFEGIGNKVLCQTCAEEISS